MAGSGRGAGEHTSTAYERFIVTSAVEPAVVRRSLATLVATGEDPAGHG